MIQISIADDHNLFRNGIISLLENHKEFKVISSVGNGKALIEDMISGIIPDVVLLDLTMPEMDGFEVLKFARKEFPSVRFIAISMHDDGQYISKSIRAGAHGYLLKNAEENELVTALHQVFKGHTYFNSQISDLVLSSIATETPTPKPLSERENEILILVSKGKTTKEIAEMLIVSARTIETHRNNMMRKLEVQNSAELIRKAIELHLI